MQNGLLIEANATRPFRFRYGFCFYPFLSVRICGFKFRAFVPST